MWDIIAFLCISAVFVFVLMNMVDELKKDRVKNKFLKRFPELETILSQKDWDLIIRTYFFVRKVCEGREESHGIHHAMNVACGAVKLYLDEEKISKFDQKYFVLVYAICGSLLHDVSDHKYDPDGKLDIIMGEFIIETFDEKQELLNIVISQVSHSKETKNKKEEGIHGRDQWIAYARKCLGMKWSNVLFLITDSDRLESLGMGGHARSVEYNTCRLTEKKGEGNFSEKDVYDAVQWIIDNKLRDLHKDIYTSAGIILAERLTVELIETHEKFLRSIS